MLMMISPSPKQNEILNCDNYLLITGGPGSGKTTIAILKAQKETKRLEDYQHILFLSFSNSAVYQIKQAAGINLNRKERNIVKVQTFHSFCFSILKSYGGICGISSPINVFPPEEEACLNAKHNFADTASKEKFLRDTALTKGRVCFDLFSEFTAQILKISNFLLDILQETYPVIIIDEFQDTDDSQWEFIKLLGQNSRLICLADPQQRIYDFRKGVTPERIKQFQSKFNPTVVDLGDDNHRSKDNEILKAANNIILNQSVSESQNLKFRTYQYPNQVGFYLKREIFEMRQTLIDGGAQSPQICILTRTNSTATRLSEQLKKKTAKANYTIRHDIILDENKILHVQRFLCFLLDFNSESPLLCVSELLSILSDLHYAIDTKTSANNAHNLAKWKQQIETGSFPTRAPVCKVLNDLVETMPNICDGNFSENVSEIKALVNGQSNQYLKPVVDLFDLSSSSLMGINIAKKAAEIFDKQNNYHGLKNFIQAHILQKKIRGTHPLNSNTVIMTMHKSKGKEYDGVIIFDGPHHDTIILKDDTNDYKRTRYLVRVAMTRAKHYVTILHQKNNRSPIF